MVRELLNYIRNRSSDVGFFFDKNNILMVALIVCSFILRTFVMAQRDLGLDEAFSYFFSQENSLWDIINPFSVVVAKDPHPPLHYVVSNLWVHSGYPLVESISGSRELAFRLPYAFLGTCTTYTLYLIGKKLEGNRLGIFLAVLHCFSSFSVQVTHQARMYPIVEFLSAISLFQFVGLKYHLNNKSLICFAFSSSLLLLTHYATAFYVVVMWIVIFWIYRQTLLKPIIGSLIALIGFIWWVPALFAQLEKEVVGNIVGSSTGIVVPFTLFHFLTGDRSLLLNPSSNPMEHLLAVISFIVVSGLATLIVMNKLVRNSFLTPLFIICLAPIILNWLATIKVHRVFSATYYAIYSLPALLALLGVIYHTKLRQYLVVKTIAILLILGINFTTVTSFYRNSLLPFEPWQKACTTLESYRPERVYVCGPHMSTLLKYYGNKMTIERLAVDFEMESLKKIKKSIRTDITQGPIALVLSHDRNKGLRYLQFFRQVLKKHPQRLDYYNIIVYLFPGQRYNENFKAVAL